MELGRQIDQLTRDVINAPMDKQSELVAQLRGKLVERFDLVQKRQKLLISQFKQKMDRLEQLLKTREANRDKIIEQDIQRIMDLAARRASGLPVDLNSTATQPAE
jgi:SAM-dependent MidA family methyltransferase